MISNMSRSKGSTTLSPARQFVARVWGQLQRPPVRLVMLCLAAALLVLSLLVPYWGITLHAPQYPKGLHVDIYAYKLTGDVSEVDGLNHYIGMIKLEDAGSFERALSRIAAPVFAALIVASFWVRGRWRWLAVAPTLAYPIVFVADLFAWLYYAGHNLDSTAALSSAIKPFTPRLLGEGIIGQFSTVAAFGPGFYMVLASALLALLATRAAGVALANGDQRPARRARKLGRASVQPEPRTASSERRDHAHAS